MENEIDRREYRRFDMKLPAFLNASRSMDAGNNYHLSLTRDISQKGAYFNTMKPFSCDGPVRVEILLNVPTDADGGIYVLLMANGEVVRRDESGLVVMFSEDCMLTPFRTERSFNSAG
jgi:hypothetical protein